MAGVSAGGGAGVEALRRAAIVPQLLRAAPRACGLRLRYGSGERSTEVVAGSRMATRRVGNPPVVTYPDVRAAMLLAIVCAGPQCSPVMRVVRQVPAGEPGYTLVMFDPDTPFGGHYLHWLVINGGTPEQRVVAKYTGACG